MWAPEPSHWTKNEPPLKEVTSQGDEHVRERWDIEKPYFPPSWNIEEPHCVNAPDDDVIERDMEDMDLDDEEDEYSENEEIEEDHSLYVGVR